MPISNLNHCAARQVGTAHISVVMANAKNYLPMAFRRAATINKRA